MWHSHELGEGWSVEDGVVRCVEVSDQEVDIVDVEVLGVPNCTGKVICPRGCDAFLGMIPKNGESMGVRSSFLSPSLARNPANMMLRVLPPSMRTF